MLQMLFMYRMLIFGGFIVIIFMIDGNDILVKREKVKLDGRN